MRYYIIAGEASGDLHASNLIKELKKKDNNAVIRCWGGELMKEQGAELVKHYKDLAFMGFIEVLKNISTILNNIKFCKKDISDFNPDVVIFVDYPGFNLRIAKFTKENNIKSFYYISPQIWAWHQSRVHKIKKIVDRMFVILPFEKDFYKKFDYEVDFVGHPLLDAISNREKSTNKDFISENNLENKPIIALLPGSRKQEIKTVLPIMLEVYDKYPEYQFVIAGTKSISKKIYNDIAMGKGVKIVYGKTYELFENSKAALVTSGTATLEAALFGVPEIVCYKGSWLSYQIAKKVITVDYISLVNLISGKEIVKELIQENLNKESLITELDKMLKDSNYIDNQKADYIELKEKLGGVGASAKAAELMIKYMNN